MITILTQPTEKDRNPVRIAFVNRFKGSIYSDRKQTRERKMMWPLTIERQGGSRIPHRRGLQPVILPKISKKPHEIEKILGRSGQRARGAHLRSATGREDADPL